MGDPRKTRKKYDTPVHPWIGPRIEEEKVLSKTYGTKNKKELYKMTSSLKRFKDIAKKLSSRSDSQADVEREQMMNKLVSLGLISAGASLDDILSLSVNDLMNRRLQTVLVKRLLARTPMQARQLIIHGHVLVDGTVMTRPSYLVKVSEEHSLGFRTTSPFNNETHPERFSEAELSAQKARQEEKARKSSGAEEEEAPPTFKEEELQDPEDAGTKKPVEATKAAPVTPVAAPAATEVKAEAKPEVKVAPVPAAPAKEAAPAAEVKPTPTSTKEATPEVKKDE